MTVEQLIEHLKSFDQSLEVVYELHSDYDRMLLEQVGVEELIEQGEWVERYYPRQHGTQKPPTKKFLAFPGN